MQLLSVLSGLVSAILIFAIFHWGSVLANKLKAQSEKRRAQEQALASNLSNLAKSLEALVKTQLMMDSRLSTESEKLCLVSLELKKALDDAARMSEKILIGTTKACEAIAMTTEKHRETVAALGKILVGSSSGGDPLTQPTEQAKDLLAAEMVYRAQGHGAEEARALAADEIERESSLPSMGY